MLQIEITNKEHDIYFTKSFGILVLIALGIVSGLFNLFYSGIFIAFLSFASIAIGYRAHKKKIYSNISKEIWIIGFLIILATIVFAVYSEPSIFSGRDQGSLSEEAIRLAQNHGYNFKTKASETFFNIYGPGKALNFPGFYYLSSGELATQFPLAYITWLAIFYSVFGLGGLVIANAILFSWFSVTFYLLCRTFLNRAYSFLAILAVLTSFAFSWFMKFTLSENLALGVLWFMIFALIKFLEKQETLVFWSFMLSGFILALTRIEGFALFAIALVILFWQAEIRKFFKNSYWKSFILPILIFVVIFLFSLTKNFNFYREIAKAVLNGSFLLPNDIAPKSNALPVLYTYQLLMIYGMLGFLVVGFIDVIRNLCKKRYKILIPFLIVSPTLIYLINSHISSDQPWMLRRFIFSILPAGIFYTFAFVYQWRCRMERKNDLNWKFMPLTLAIILIAINLPAFFNFLTYSENRSLLNQTQKLSQNFQANDLVLVDRLASGDGWAMLSGPLNFIYGKNSAYFFNADDLGKINYQDYDHVYLVVPNGHENFYLASNYGDKLTFFRDYSLETQRLNVVQNKFDFTVSFPKKEKETIKGKIYLINN